MTFQLYDYQETLVNKARQAYLDGYNAPCIVAPCGSGKSVMIAEIIRTATANKNKVLFIVHRQELIEQIEKTLIANEVDMDYVKLGMVQTIARRYKKMQRPDLIVVDENHHVLAQSYRNIINHFQTKVIGFTATPIRLNGSGLGDINDILIEEVDVDWLIEHKRLAPFDYYMPNLIDSKKLKKSSTGDFDSKSIDAALGKMIFGDVIKQYRKLADNTQAIVYCHSIEFSKTVAKEFNDAGIPAKHVDANTPKSERSEIIQEFRDKKTMVLCNVDLFGEGFDVP
ncbi:DEAD/DEAH box helicase, partial [Jeotgalibaca porci]